MQAREPVQGYAIVLVSSGTYIYANPAERRVFWQMSEELQHNPLQITENIFCQCTVCQRMETEDTELLAEYIQECCNKHTLSTILKLALEFTNMLHTKRQSKQAKTSHASCVETRSYDFESIDVIRHVLYCVSTKLPQLRNIVCNAKAMQMLLESQTIGQTSTAIKLLQTSNAGTAKNSSSE